MIRKIRIFQIKIPFSVQVTHNLARRNGTSGFLVEITDGHGIKGYGEGTPRSYVTGEDFSKARDAIGFLGRSLLGSELKTEGFFLQFWDELKKTSRAAPFPSAVCSVELALLDLYCKKARIPVWNLFRQEPATHTISYSSILPLLERRQRQAILELTKRYEISQVKTKASSIDETVQVAMEIKEALGGRADIRIDANEAFRPAQAVELIGALRAAGIEVSAMEQPVAKDDLEGMRRFEEETGIPAVADESFCTPGDLQRIISRRSCKGVNVRLSKCGGMMTSTELVRRAKEAGLFCQLGCHVGETSVLYAAGRHLSAICGPFRYTEGCYSRFLLEEDIVERPLEFGTGGRTGIPSKPGLGIEVREEALRRHCTMVFEAEK